MAHSHDRKSSSLAASSMMQAPRQPEGEGFILCQERATDPLSGVLRMVKLTGAVFHLVEASLPWGVEIPRASDYAAIVLPGAQHVISYHIILKGSGFASVPGVISTWFEAGDILVLPHGDRYLLLSTPGQAPEYDRNSTIAFFRDWMAGRLPFVTREGGGGAGGAEYMCGFLGCDMRPFNPLLSTLPRLLRVKRSAGGRNDLLGPLIELALADAHLPRLGGEAIRLRLCELIFVEVVRLHLESLAAYETGWLSGLRDPVIGKVLTVLHERPAHPWTLNELAGEAAISRAALARRFTHLVGLAPMRYLTLWRMQIAARLLADSSLKVGAVGREIGYESEAAFSRAFTRSVGASPAAWRDRAAAAG